jgi:hypothetical protein
MTTAKLTDSQFEAADDAFTARLRATKLGTPERAEAVAFRAAWDAAYALPQRTFAQREERFAALYEASKAVGVVS